MYQSPGGVDLRFTTVPDGLLTSSALARFTYNIVQEREQIWYALTNLYGDPFFDRPVTMMPVNPSGYLCRKIRWPSGVPTTTGRTRVNWCGPYTSFHLYLCGGEVYDDNGQTEESARIEDARSARIGARIDARIGAVG
uniref:Uncharacterized protein n=1 Tax=Talaromyces marneffei PM1 TaxID=1077442 RepID=A0A093UT95_TALMA